MTVLAEPCIYALSNVPRTIHVRVTSDLERRLYEHQRKLSRGFARRYNLALLVCYEITPDIVRAISRQEQIRGWVRAKKVSLIE